MAARLPVLGLSLDSPNPHLDHRREVPLVPPSHLGTQHLLYAVEIHISVEVNPWIWIEMHAPTRSKNKVAKSQSRT